ncbi:hypothetical protein ACFX13_029023 [Malus domestica]|uniref:Uncharacterized protein n=1 Tax=Malus domestica TaxID=3750 RepID=A0A498KCE7_MALDO|nr:hypothetical protein DVH24_006465 [Malus domestica]
MAVIAKTELQLTDVITLALRIRTYSDSIHAFHPPSFSFFPPNQILAAADFGDARLPRDPELPRSSSPPWIRFGDANSPSESEGVEAENNRRTFQNRREF